MGVKKVTEKINARTFRTDNGDRGYHVYNYS